RQRAAEKENRHHFAAAPGIAEPAPRQRKNAERNEARGRKRDQLAVRALQIDHQYKDHRRKKQDDGVVDEVSEVEQTEIAARVVQFQNSRFRRHYTGPNAPKLLPSSYAPLR